MSKEKFTIAGHALHGQIEAIRLLTCGDTAINVQNLSRYET